LNRRHQWQRKHHGPQHREPELRACLRVGGDAARIVVGGSGDESRAKLAQRVTEVDFADGLDDEVLGRDDRLQPIVDHR
jgi:hypothetical protein